MDQLELIDRLLKELNYPFDDQIDKWRSEMWTDKDDKDNDPLSLWFVLGVHIYDILDIYNPETRAVFSLYHKIIEKSTIESLIKYINSTNGMSLLLWTLSDKSKFIKLSEFKGPYTDRNIFLYYSSILNILNESEYNKYKNLFDEAKTYYRYNKFHKHKLKSKYMEDQIWYLLYFYNNPSILTVVMIGDETYDYIINVIEYCIEEGMNVGRIASDIISMIESCPIYNDVLSYYFNKYKGTSKISDIDNHIKYREPPTVLKKWNEIILDQV